jgi:hypothetical protein
MLIVEEDGKSGKGIKINLKYLFETGQNSKALTNISLFSHKSKGSKGFPLSSRD